VVALIANRERNPWIDRGRKRLQMRAVHAIADVRHVGKNVELSSGKTGRLRKKLAIADLDPAGGLRLGFGCIDRYRTRWHGRARLGENRPAFRFGCAATRPRWSSGLFPSPC